MDEIKEFFRKLFDTSDWPPRWYCGRWTDFHGWLYIISDLLVWSAYFAIPMLIIRYITKRHDARFVRLYFLFAAFILACGATHFMDAITFWYPAYRLNALILFITGVISWVTVFYLIKLLPMAFSLRSSGELEAEVEQREKAENRFRKLLESAPDAMVIVNDRGLIELVNAQAEKMFGYTREEMMGNTVELLMPGRYTGTHEAHRNHYVDMPKVRQMGEGQELYGKRKDGTEFPVEISLSPLETEEGLLVSSAIRDMTEKKLLEKEIREANITLERKVQQRTAELERKNRELEQFAYVASHDLQEPLRTTASFVELLRKKYEGKLDDTADQYINYIVQSSGRMKTLVKDLLDYSRLGRGKELKQVDCNLLLAEVRADLDKIIHENQAEIIAAELPTVTGYGTELKLLFQNLINNSIKFRKPDEAPRVHITSKRENGSWEFSFADNGIGMEPQHLDKIFVIFQRLHTRTVYEGSGIGLAHCKKIVEMHGGRIGVTSEIGKGSTFFFTIHEMQGV